MGGARGGVLCRYCPFLYFRRRERRDKKEILKAFRRSLLWETAQRKEVWIRMGKGPGALVLLACSRGAVYLFAAGLQGGWGLVGLSLTQNGLPNPGPRIGN